jgi:exopolyphosphatase/guanosine-5'-triphosphate,3'-diphosphate pyrophosphatase
MSLNERKNLSGLSSSRAEQIVAGALVAQIAMKELQIESIEICPWALREGIVLQRLDWLKS